MEDIKLARDLYETYPGPCKLNDCGGCKYFNYDNICLQLKQAESLIAKGYRKVKWHKITDKDLPKPDEEVLVYYKNYYHEKYVIRTGYWYDFHCGYRRWFVYDTVDNEVNESNIVAWMEIPKYLEF